MIEIKEQTDILDSHGKNLIISASAGSGKTTIMIKKILQAILDEKISVKEILVLTYTKASASEMKQRLENALCENIEDSFCREQYDNLPVADITTFHAFYQKLIKKYFYIININPSFKVLDENLAKNLKDIALTETLKKYSETKEEDYFFLYQMFSRGRSNLSIKELVLEMNEFLLSISDENFIHKCLKYFETNDAENYINEYLVSHLQTHINSLKKLQIECEKNGFDKYIENINKTLSQIECINLKKSLAENIEIISLYKVETLREDKKKDFISFKDKIQAVKDRLKSLIGEIVEYNFGDEECIKKSHNVCKKVIEILVDINAEFNNTYASLKNEKGAFDFNDLEFYAQKILENEKIRQELREKYRYIFVDEFQDANMVQENFLQKISGEDNRFMVGDVKQSIYAFRQSDPDIFISLQNKYELEESSESKKLNSNFRSHKDILNFVNDIFKIIMTKDTAGIDYKNEAMFVPRAEYKNNSYARVNIDILQKEKEDNIQPSGVYSVKNHIFNDDEKLSAEREAQVVASRISQLINEKIYDAKTEKFRNVEYGDIAILLRSRGAYLSTFSASLTSYGIPVKQNTNENLLDLPDGQIAKSLLEFTNNEKQDLPLSVCLLSVIGGFTENEVATIRKCYPDQKYFYEATLLYKAEKEDSLSSKLHYFYDTIADLRYNIKYYGVHKSLYSFYDKIGLKEKLYSFIDGERRYKNFTTFADFFASGMTINEFISLKNPSISVKDDIKQASVIDITTMHSSKGLEYPIVFVCNMGKDFNKKPKVSNIQISKTGKMATKFFDVETNQEHSSVFFESIKKENRKTDFAEQLRLLYVALTRAKNHLYIVGTTDFYNIETLEDKCDILNQKDYLSLILGALDKKILEKIKLYGNYQSEDNELSICVENFDAIGEDVLSKDKKVLKVENQYVDELASYIEFDYKSNNIAYKNTVSKLASSDNYSSKNFAPEKLKLSEHLIETNSNDRGTCYHKILELIDFNDVKCIEDVSKNINKFIAEGKIKIEDSEDISCENIFNNISILQGIIKDSKIFKEQQFMMKVPYSEVTKSEIQENVLVQGIVDLFVDSEEKILVDYKLTKVKDDKVLINRYKKQIELYKMALESALSTKISKCYILNLTLEKLIEIK